ncbi:DnaJ domain-containing protein [Spiroplasma endosymbiont of Diplazon laetatorius]|uniref:DnaJ domain-containing protein n=1 Tax=Spiroplasma endosymbiont of Diplazon laetatorius TaxID=3066322 RepID=UPI0030D547EF
MKKESEKKSNIFDYSDGISSNIIWNRSMNSANHWVIDTLLSEISRFNKEIKEILSIQELPDQLGNYSWKIESISTNEDFYSYPMASYFKETYNSISNKLGSYEAALIVASLSKFAYYTTEKFWKVFNYTFANKSINEKPLLRVFEVMQRTAIDSINGIIDKSFLLIDKKQIDPYKHHLLIEEIIDLGDDFTYHWSRMLDQVVDLTVETFVFQNEYGQTNSSSYSSTYSDFFANDDEDDFDGFFEKTKTMVFNDEVNDAFNYFGISKMAKPDEFKKIYRKMAKQFHPDLNPDPSAAIEMKKINMFKEIVEQYYDKYDIV